MTPQQQIARKLAPKIRRALTLTEAYQAAPAGLRQRLEDAARAGDVRLIGRLVDSMMSALARDRAMDRAAQMLADGSLSAAEIDEVLG